MAVDSEVMRRKVGEVIKKGVRPATTDPQELPYTSRAKGVLELAMTEARELGQNYVGTEHLLLGLIREEKGIGAQVLVDAGATLPKTREAVVRLLRARGDAVRGATGEPASEGSGALIPVELPYVATPRVSPYQAAFRILWWTLGVVVLGEGLRPFIREWSGAEVITPFVAIRAGVQVAGALLFLVPRTLKIGALTLIALFVTGFIAHVVRGEFFPYLLVYAAAAHFCLLVQTTKARGERLLVKP